jgi:hypothetical protein
MADPITMMAIGAGVGALKGAVTGGNPLKEALIGGVLGGITGGAGQALGLGGAAAGTAGTVAGTAGKGAVDLSTKAAFEASMGLPSTAFLESGGSLATALGGTTKAMGLVPTTAGSSLSYNPEYYSNILGNQVYTGGEGVLSNAISQFTPSMADLKQYATIDNLAGATAIASQFKPTPRSPAPQGRITEGKLPQSGIGQGGVEGLLAELQKQQQQQYQPISLL